MVHTRDMGLIWKQSGGEELGILGICVCLTML